MKLFWEKNTQKENCFNVRLKDTFSKRCIGWVIFTNDKIHWRQSIEYLDVDIAELNAIVEEIKKHRNPQSDDISDHEGGWKQGWANTDSMA